MLTIMVYGVDAVIPGHAAGKQSLEFFERDRDPIERFARPTDGEQLAHRGGHRGGGTDLDGIRNVVIVTAKIVHRRSLSSLRGARYVRSSHRYVKAPVIYAKYVPAARLANTP